VVKDFHFDVLTTPVSGLLIDINPDQFAVLTIRFNNQDIPALLQKVETTWNAHFPEKSFQYYFLDEQLQQEYSSFDRFSGTIQLFTFLAIFISSLGVYGLVLFTLKRKVKEIGIRKVLGATTISILKLIYSDFTWLVVMAFVVAVPAAYWLMNEWLKEFAYRTTIDAGPFIVSFLIILGVMTFTIGVQAFRTALKSPINSLRNE
jgi:putative ABC transport system permease protein